jgi:hypothetical protein
VRGFLRIIKCVNGRVSESTSSRWSYIQFQVRYDESIDCVIGEFRGNMEMDSLKAYVAEIGSVAKRHPCRRFFNNLREAEINFSITDIYNLTGTLLAGEFDGRWRRANLFNPDLAKDKREFHETVSANRGVLEKSYTDYTEAMEWLLSKRS